MTRLNREINRGYFNSNGFYWNKTLIQLFNEEELHLILEKNNLPDTMCYWLVWDEGDIIWIPFSDDHVMSNPQGVNLTNIYDHDTDTYAQVYSTAYVTWDLGSIKVRMIETAMMTYADSQSGADSRMYVSEDNITWVQICRAHWQYVKEICWRVAKFRYIKWYAGAWGRDAWSKCFEINMSEAGAKEYPGHEIYTCNSGIGCSLYPMLIVNGNTFNMMYTNIIK